MSPKGEKKSLLHTLDADIVTSKLPTLPQEPKKPLLEPCSTVKERDLSSREHPLLDFLDFLR